MVIRICTLLFRRFYFFLLPAGHYLFHDTGLSDEAVGGLVLIISFVMLMTCLILMVKLLKSMLAGSMSKAIQRTINADFPGRAACLTGYVAILVGCAATVLVQSSSVVISALTPIVGLGMVSLDRVFPMMLGANLGTTSTAIIAAFAASGDRVEPAFQIALCHLFFNISGICIWYVIPPMRKVPLGAAKFLGKTISIYRWFSVVYGLGTFFILPGIIFALSLPGWEVLVGVGVPVLAVIVCVIVIKLLQRYCPHRMHPVCRTWGWLPIWMRSLEPLDAQITKCLKACRCHFCRKLGGVDDPNDERDTDDPGSVGAEMRGQKSDIVYWDNPRDYSSENGTFLTAQPYRCPGGVPMYYTASFQFQSSV